MTGEEGLSADPAVREVQIENRIRAAYAAAWARRVEQRGRPTGAGSQWVGLVDVRDGLGGDVSRDEADRALIRLAQQPGTHIIPVGNLKSLNDRDRAAALHTGGEAKHAMSMDDPSPRPLPTPAPVTTPGIRRLEDVELRPTDLATEGEKLLRDARTGAFDNDKDALPKRLASMRSPEVREAAKLLGINTEGDRGDDVRDKLRHAIGQQRGLRTDPLDEERARLRKLDIEELARMTAEHNDGIQILGNKEMMIDAILGPRIIPGRKFHVTETSGTRRLRRFARGKKTTTETFDSGFGTVRLMENDNGDKVIHKHIKTDWFTTGEQQADAENLSSRIGHAIGAPVADVFQDSDRSVYMSHVSGDVADNADADVREAAIRSPKGRMVALLDALTGNEDRHGNNWLIDDNGDPVAIDNGLAFRVPSARNADGSSRPAPAHDGDEFRQHWGSVTGDYEESQGDPEAFDWGSDLPWSREELEEIRPKLQALEPEFANLDRQAWHKEMMDRLDAMIARAKPAATKSSTGERGTGAGSGRDLTPMIGDSGSVEAKALRKAARRWNQGHSNLGYSDPEAEKEGELVLRELARQQGWDRGQPQMGSPQELDDVIASGGVELWRGNSGRIEPEIWGYGPDEGKPFLEGFREDQSPVHFNREMRSGELRYGTGVYGNGIYTSVSRDTADSFGTRSYTQYDPEAGTGGYGPADPRSIQRMVLRPDARVVDFDELQKQARSHPEIPAFIRNDPGRLAAALGYDAVHIRGTKKRDDGRYRQEGRPSDVSPIDPDQYLILNRNAVLFQDHDEHPLAPSTEAPVRAPRRDVARTGPPVARPRRQYGAVSQASFLQQPISYDGQQVKNVQLENANYQVGNATAWRRDGITYLIEHPDHLGGRLEAQRIMEELESFHASLPAEASPYQDKYFIVQGDNPLDAAWATFYDIPDFTSAATAGEGEITVWNSSVYMAPGSGWPIMLDHETGHNVSDGNKWRNLHAQGPAWHQAVSMDYPGGMLAPGSTFKQGPGKAEGLRLVPDPSRPFPNGVTEYGTSSDMEDYAEAIALYFQGFIGEGVLKGKRASEPLWFRDLFPQRAAIFDQIFPQFAARQQARIAQVRSFPIRERMGQLRRRKPGTASAA